MTRVKTATAGLALAAATIVATPALAQGDPEEGEQVYRQCQACHVINSEQNRVGPHLVGLFGREAGAVDGFRYSEVMEESDVVWDEDTLDEFLADPAGFMPDNRMAFRGIQDEEARADLIAYLREATQ
jgi:cytochrome c2